MSRFAWFTVAVIIFIGSIRVIYSIPVIGQLFLSDHAPSQSALVKHCEGVFGDDKQHRDASNAPVDLESVTDKTSETQNRCQKWAVRNQQIDQDFFVINVILVAVGFFLGVATLLIALGVIQRSKHVSWLIFFVLIVQILASLGNIYKSVLENKEHGVIMTTLWPGLESVEQGWLLLHGGIYLELFMSILICCIYLAIVLILCSKRMHT